MSMSDLITAAAVKKAYRKATLCIHPDKVQQKGATLQQKYIAEKVFDILKVCHVMCTLLFDAQFYSGGMIFLAKICLFGKIILSFWYCK